jgi:hypothetical protein
MSVRIIQTFVRTCNDCPHNHYYSGGMYQCSLTDERMSPERKKDRVGDLCPLPFAGRATVPSAPASGRDTP